ncbi:MAG: hypothetical protein JWP52_374, partial [Rhizobacter sp.]|nr:hypothetical protein [Rhizobacter sp.]
MENDGVHFLATKTVPPTRPHGVLPRPRLTGLASQLWHHLLTVVKAPPGYGKTTLALAWSSQLAALGALVGWLSLDPSDCDIARFAFYVTTALDRAGIDVLKIRQAMLAPLCVVNPDSLVALLLNGIAEQSNDVFLFLDDIHCLMEPSLADAAPGEPSVLAMVALLCRRAPPNLHLVMLGRADLPSSLLSQVSPENLLEVDATALGFDLAETTQLAHKLRGEPLAPDEIHALHTTTQGWPAAIRAVLLSLNHGMKPQLCGKAFAPNRPISALMEDVLDHLPLALTDFMIRLAVVDKVCVDLAAALTDAPDARSMLEQIGHRQLFFSARDAEQRWFSFHPLFRDQLLRRLSDTHAAEVGALHRRADEWFAANDLWSHAVCHALLAGDNARAIAWIEQCAMRLVQTGDLLTLLSWQSQLRSHFLEMPPRLKLAFAWALGHAMASTEATRLLDQIEAGLTDDDPQTDDMRWECLALRALLRNVDDDGDAAYLLARQYLAHDPRDAWIRNVMLNIVASTHLRTGHWQAFHSVAPLVVVDEERTRPGCFVFNRCYHLCYR